MKKQTLFVATLLTSGAILSGCRAKTSFPGAQNDAIIAPVVAAPQLPTESPATASEFVVTARAAKTQFAANEPIELQIEIKNVSGKTATLNFTSGQNFDFSATRAGESEAVWNYAMNKRFIQILRSQQLETGKSLPFSTTWQGASPGRYTIKSLITANGGLSAAPFEIVVK